MLLRLNRRLIALLLASIGVALLVAACSSSSKSGSKVQLKLAPVSELPKEIQETDPKVAEAYRFAIANQEYLAQFPCYCGCGGMGHQSNRDCYIRDVKPDGSIVFETHAFY